MRKATTLTSCSVCPVRQLNIFKQLPSELVDAIENYRTEQVTLPAKTFLYKQGEEHSNTYTLFSGWVMLYKTLDNGSRQILRYALPGDFLSFQADLNSPINHSAQVLTECSFCVFPRKSILQMFEHHPELASQIAWITARDMSLSHEYLVNIGRKNAKERMAYLFLDLYHRLCTQVEYQENTIPFPMTQEDIADTIGLTLVHVNRTLRSLREEGLVKLAHHQLTILDYATLASLAGFTRPLNAQPQPLL
ncbi:Crp/Fnr family transcriptional regulator [Candidatus Albibeggiatoa sp. nov. BB20]|uniref:Crp/Fnr family transcriptional regulator n=1 Tax=Candidatus Albibeggiatoa sp. nov. BB20 TaxID=3162723 RepID=UPI0033659A7D